MLRSRPAAAVAAKGSGQPHKAPGVVIGGGPAGCLAAIIVSTARMESRFVGETGQAAHGLGLAGTRQVACLKEEPGLSYHGSDIKHSALQDSALQGVQGM